MENTLFDSVHSYAFNFDYSTGINTDLSAALSLIFLLLLRPLKEVPITLE